MAAELPRRSTNPIALLSPFADAALALVSYPLAFRIATTTFSLRHPFDSAGQRLLPVVLCQMLALALMGAYSAPLRRLWPRVMLAALVGTAAGAVLTRGTARLDSASALAFALDGLLVALAAFAWRTAVLLTLLVRERRATVALDPLMEDRADRLGRAGLGLLGIIRYRQLLRNLVAKDLKLKYRGSVFGFFWSLLNPLVMVAVYTVAFTYIMRVTETGFVFRLLVGLLAWGFFANALTMSTGAILDNRGMVKNVFFPRTILPLATVLFNLAQFLLSVVVFVPLLLLLFRVKPSFALAAFPLVLALNVIFVAGIAMLLATATTFFRDVQHLLEVSLAALFWTTPVVYSYQQLPAVVRTPVLLSPLSSFVVAYQQIFCYRQWPGGPELSVAALYAAVAFISGFMLFAAFEDRFAEQV